jgi:hypothetical protein
MFGYRVSEILDLLPPTLSVCGEPAPVVPNPENKVLDLGRSTSRAYDIDREVTAYKTLDFGWRLVRALVSNRLALPRGISIFDDAAIVRAYDWEARVSDDRAVTAAVALGCEPRMRGERELLEALMLCEDYDREWVAREFDVHEDILLLYEELFFNVVDRRTEDMWLSTYVYNNRKIEEQLEGYISVGNASKILRRAGYANGMAAVLQLAGARSAKKKAAAMTLADTRKAFELEITKNGLLLAQNGWAGQSENSTAVRRTQSMISAAKMGGDGQDESGSLLDNDMSFSLYQNMKTDLRAQDAERSRRLHSGKN